MQKETLAKNQFRRQLRHDRSALSIALQTQHSNHITQQLLALPIFQQSANIALYLPIDNEVDITALFSLNLGKKFFLPVVTSMSDLLFAHYEPGHELKPNQFGILEPVMHVFCPPDELDLVCTPLVGFDLRGHRLGTGAGYYDRTFAFKREIQSKPYLLGVGYECQKVAQLPVQAWDVPLWGVQTELNLYGSI